MKHLACNEPIHHGLTDHCRSRDVEHLDVPVFSTAGFTAAINCIHANDGGVSRGLPRRISPEIAAASSDGRYSSSVVIRNAPDECVRARVAALNLSIRCCQSTLQCISRECAYLGH